MIFLGAGASAPFSIPTTSKLTTEIQTLLKKENENLLTDMISFWKGCYDEREPNYENILTILMGLTDTRKISKTSIVRAFLKDFSKYKNNYDNIIDEIYSRIIKYCSSPFMSGEQDIEPSELEDIFHKTYDLFPLFYNDLIFTTNYDPSLEIWCQKRNIRLHDGTQNTMNPEIKKMVQVDLNTVESGNTNIVIERNSQPSLKLIRLHGSVWTYETKNNKRIKINRPIDRLLFTDWYSFLPNKPLMIFPGQESVLSSGDWDIQYQYFKKMLRGNCLVIGYSFNDPLINNAFIDSLERNQLNKLGILDPFPENVVNNLFWNRDFPEDKIIKIEAKFGDDYAVNRLYDDWIKPVRRIKYGSGIGHEINKNIRLLKEYLQ